MNTNSQHGFTLWELLASIAIAGVILGIGVPSFMQFQRNNAMAAATNELVSAVLLARAEAVKRQVPVTVCASADPTDAAPDCDADQVGTNGGFIVWVDENRDAVVDADEILLAQREEPGGTIDVWADGGYITFGANGFPGDDISGLGSQMKNVLYCDDRGNQTAAAGLSTARTVRIRPTGRAEVLRRIADVNDAITAVGGGVCT